MNTKNNGSSKLAEYLIKKGGKEDNYFWERVRNGTPDSVHRILRKGK